MRFLLIFVLSTVVGVGLRAETTTRLTDQVRHEYNSSAPAHFANLSAGQVLFTATPPGRNSPLPYVTDGTAGGTICLLPSLPADQSMAPGGFLFLGGSGYFFTQDYNYALSFWKTNGTPGGTTLVSSALPANLHSVSILNGSFIGAGVPSSGASGSVLWKSDGTPGGTSIFFTSAPEVSFTSGIVHGNSYLLAAVITHPVDGRRDAIWKSDGTAGGTAPVKELSFDHGSGPVSEQFPAALTVFGGVVYFLTQEFALDVPSGQTYERSVLWKTDGTSPGTLRLGSLPQLFQSMRVFGGSLFIEKDGTVDLGGSVNPPAIMKSDGTFAGTTTVFSGSQAGGPYIGLSPVGEFDGYFYYNCIYSNPVLPSSSRYSNLCRMGPGGTMELVAALPSVWQFGGYELSFAQHAATRPSGLYLRIVGARQDVWKVSGTLTPTVQHLGPGAIASDAEIGGRMIGSGDDLTTGTEIYSDLNGLTLVADLAAGVASSDPTYAGFLDRPRASVGNILLFNGQDEVHGSELWRSDGSIGGTSRVADLSPGAYSSTIEHIIPATASAWVILRRGDIESVYGTYQLWKTDTTPGGTTFVRQAEENKNWSAFATDGTRLVAITDDAFADDTISILDGPGSGNVLATGNFGGKIVHSSGNFWWVQYESATPGLRRSDGSANPPVIAPPPADHHFQSLETAFGDGVVGVTRSKSSPDSLYDDLTHLVWFRPSGPVVLRTFDDFGSFRGFAVHGGKLYFTYYAYPNTVLHVSDGAAGTTTILDTAYEIAGDTGTKFTFHDGYVYYPRKAADYSDPLQVFRTAGTPATTGATAIVLPADAYSVQLVSAGGWLLYDYLAYDIGSGESSDETRRTAGQADGVPVTGMLSSDLSFYQQQPYLSSRSDNIAFFHRTDPTDGSELWKVELPQAPPTTPFGLWAQGHGLAGNDALPGEDADRDGVKNIVEFYTGTLPGDRTSAFKPSFSTISPGGTPIQIISIPRMPGTGLTLTLESSVDLVAWNTDATVSPDGTLTHNPTFKRTGIFSRTGSSPESLTFAVFPANTYPKVFVRFRVTE